MTVMPLASGRVIPEGWSRHHQKPATGGMNASCRVTDPARSVPGVFDPATGQRGASSPHVVIDAAACRVQALRGGDAAEQAAQPTARRDYLIQLDDAGLDTLTTIEAGYVVTILASVNDPHLVGRGLEVVDVQYGSERFTRDVVCRDNQQPKRAV